jgi:hypothetical protein
LHIGGADPCKASNWQKLASPTSHRPPTFTAVPVWFVNAGWPPSVIEYVTVALSAESTVTFVTVALVDFAIGDEPRAVITGAKVCPFCSSCALREAGVAPSKNSDHAAAILAASADSAPEAPDAVLLVEAVALGEEGGADGDELLFVVEESDDEELLHPAVARTTVSVIAATKRALSRIQTTTALPFSRRWTDHPASSDATAISYFAALSLRPVHARGQVGRGIAVDKPQRPVSTAWSGRRYLYPARSGQRHHHRVGLTGSRRDEPHLVGRVQ